MKIDALVQLSAPRIFAHCDAAEFARLQEPRYCKHVFDIDFPFCMASARIGPAGHFRFFTKEYFAHGARVRLTSQWYEPPLRDSRDRLLAYMERRKIPTPAAADITGALMGRARSGAMCGDAGRRMQRAPEPAAAMAEGLRPAGTEEAGALAELRSALQPAPKARMPRSPAAHASRAVKAARAAHDGSTLLLCTPIQRPAACAETSPAPAATTPGAMTAAAPQRAAAPAAAPVGAPCRNASGGGGPRTAAGRGAGADLPPPSRRAATLPGGAARAFSGAEFSSAEWREVVDDFGGRCAYCGAERELVMSDIVPHHGAGARRRGLGDLAPACRPCAARKAGRSAQEFLADDPFRLLRLEAHMRRHGAAPPATADLARSIIACAQEDVRRLAERYVGILEAALVDPPAR